MASSNNNDNYNFFHNSIKILKLQTYFKKDTFFYESIIIIILLRLPPTSSSSLSSCSSSSPLKILLSDHKSLYFICVSISTRHIGQCLLVTNH